MSGAAIDHKYEGDDDSLTELQTPENGIAEKELPSAEFAIAHDAVKIANDLQAQNDVLRAELQEQANATIQYLKTIGELTDALRTLQGTSAVSALCPNCGYENKLTEADGRALGKL